MDRSNHHHLKPLVLTRFWERARGLLLREVLLDQGGVLITPCHSIHTFGMTRAIDVIFLDGLGWVKEIRSDVKPCRAIMRKSREVLNTLEISAGSAKRQGIEVGDQISFF
jgi:uncharacterized protein